MWKCYFRERKIFSSVWLHFKKCFEKYFLLFGCVLENTIENTFSTCCSHFLSCQTNIYYHSSIQKHTQKKKFIKSGQIERRRKREVRSAAIGAVRSLLWSAWCDRLGLWSSDRSSVWRVRCCGHRTGARSEDWALSLSLSLSLSLRMSLEMVWSENFHFKPFLGQSY